MLRLFLPLLWINVSIMTRGNTVLVENTAVAYLHKKFYTFIQVEASPPRIQQPSPTSYPLSN
jgi:hypothetical protein